MVKKVLKAAMLALPMLLALTSKAQTSNPQSLENRAVAAAQSCAQAYTGPGTRVFAELVGQGRCFDGGTVNTYAVKVGYTAPPPQLPYILLPAPRTVALVTFSCDNDVESVVCQ